MSLTFVTISPQRMRKSKKKNMWTFIFISVANSQNPFSLHLVKLRNRALKFLVHFSLVCLGKCPKAYEKWSQIEKRIWGSIFHPSGMLWGPFRGRFLQVLQPKGVFWSPFLCISCIYKSSKPLPVANEWQLQWEGVQTICTLIVNAMGRGFQKVFVLHI